MNAVKTGEFIAKMRKEKGMTQKELAQKLYVTDKAVSKWERGLAYPDTKVLSNLADVLGVSILELLTGILTDSSEKNEENIVLNSIEYIDKENKNNKKKRDNKRTAIVILIALILIGLMWAHYQKSESEKIGSFFESMMLSMMGTWESNPLESDFSGTFTLNEYIWLRIDIRELNTIFELCPDTLNKMKYQNEQELYLSVREKAEQLENILLTHVTFENDKVSLDENFREQYIDATNGLVKDFDKLEQAIVKMDKIHEGNPFIILYNFVESEWEKIIYYKPL